MTDAVARVPGSTVPTPSPPEPSSGTAAGSAPRPAAVDGADRAERADAPRRGGRAAALDRVAYAYLAGGGRRSALEAWLRDHPDDLTALARLPRERLRDALGPRLEGEVWFGGWAKDDVANAVADAIHGRLREAIRHEAADRLHLHAGAVARAIAHADDVAAALRDPSDPAARAGRAVLGLTPERVTPAAVRERLVALEADVERLRDFVLGQRWMPADVPGSTATALRRLGLEGAPGDAIARDVLSRGDRWAHGAVIEADAWARRLVEARGAAGARVPPPLAAVAALARAMSVPAHMARSHLEVMALRAERLGL